MSSILVDNYNINYKITGAGSRYILMLQGWGTTLEVYDSVAAAVGNAYQFIQLDLPGFGKSDEPREPWAVDDYADFVEKFLKAIEIDSVILMGHSYGGRIIIKLANRDNLDFNIEKIVLVDAAGIMPKKTFLQKLKVKKYKILKKIFNIKVMEILFPELIEDWRSRQGSADYRNATPIMRQTLVKSVNEDLTHLLAGIRQETLLVWGDKDTATPIEDAHKMDELIPNSGLVVLEGTGHYSFLEKPGMFRNVLRAFLGIGEN